MKILMLNYEFPPIGGGAANATYYLLKEFSKSKEIEIDLVTASPKNKFVKERFSKNITIYRLNVNKKNPNYQTFSETFLWSAKTYFTLGKLIQERKYELCHCWFGWPSGFFGYLWRKDVPYLIGLRGTDVPGFNPRFKQLDKLVWPSYSKIVWGYAEKIITNSDGLKKLANKTWDGEIDIIYNGIDTNEFKPKKKTNKTIKLLTVSRLISRKGLKYLIKAMPKIIEANINVQLDIIGEGPDKQKLKNLTREYGISDKIKFFGHVKHSALPKIYQESDIFILPSLYEGMSNTILEAMASGLPIITTNTGGSKELIKENGVIIKKKSSRNISAEVINLMKDKDRRLLYGKNSRKIALKFSWENVAKQYFNMYKQIIN